MNKLTDIGRGLKVGIINITPEQAVKMLERNTKNRSINKGRVSRYAIDISDGKWKLNGVPIVFDKNGMLTDGQHRLQAIIRANIAIETLVVHGVSDESFTTIDTGKNRSGGDVLSIAGLDGVKARSLAQLIIRIFQENSNRLGRAYTYSMATSDSEYARIKQTLTNEDILEYYNNNYNELDAVYEFCNKFRSKSAKVLNFGIFTMLFYKLRKINLLDAEYFIEHLATGAELNEQSPIYHLRERFINLKNSDSEKVPAWHIPAYTYKAWNAFRRKDKMIRLRIRSEETLPVKPI